MGGGGRKQEQTMFDDLRRGFTEDFQGLTEFERTLKDQEKKDQGAYKNIPPPQQQQKQKQLEALLDPSAIVSR